MGSLGFAPTGWDFTAYTSTTTSIETLSDGSGGDSDAAYVSDAVTVTGAGAGNAGTSVETASGYFWYDRARSDLAPTTLATAVVLTGPTLPGLGAAGAPSNWMLNPGNGLWTPAASLTAVQSKLVTAPTAAGVAAPPMTILMGLGLAQTPPALQGVAAGPTLTPSGYANIMGNGYAAGFSYRGWLGPQAGNPALIGPGAYAGPWAFLNALSGDLSQAAKLANAAYSGGLGRFASQSVGQAQAVFEAAVARVQGVPSNNLFVYVDEAIDFVGGVINSLTAGLASRLVGELWSFVNALTGLSLASLVNTSSSAYAAGGVAGQVLGLVLMAVPGLGGALMAVQAVGMGLNAADAFARGDTATGFLDLEGALLAGVGAAEAAEAAEGSVAVAEEGPALGSGETAGEVMGPGAGSQPLELTVTGDITAAEGAVLTPTESLPDLGGGGQDPYKINARMFGADNVVPTESAAGGEPPASGEGESESGSSTTSTGGGTEQTGSTEDGQTAGEEGAGGATSEDAPSTPANPNAPRPVVKSPKGADPRVTQELPPNQVRTPEENAAARKFFENHKDKAIEWWEQRTGQQWPEDATHAHHPRELANGGDPLDVEPGYGGSTNPGEHPLEQFQEWGRQGGRPRKP